jgi:hypothetical protein
MSRSFVQSAKLPALQRGRRTRGPLEDSPPLQLRESEAQSLVVGSGLIVAGEKVPVQTREDLVNCTLFAQLAASGEASESSKVMEWYDAYFRWLSVLGWAQSDRQFQDYHFGGRQTEAHKAVEKVLVALLGPQAAAVVVIQVALQALQEMNENSPWLTLFDRQSRTERAARFQVAAAQVDATGLVQIALVAFAMKAKATFTQVLFFKSASSSSSLKYAAGKATIFEAALRDQREQVAQRLAEYRRQLVGEVKLPPLPAATARALRARAVKFKPGKAVKEV